MQFYVKINQFIDNQTQWLWAIGVKTTKGNLTNDPRVS